MRPLCSTNQAALGGKGADSRHSFTLVELLVVVSIIALLISILLPSLKKARDQAKTVACAANLSGLAKANAIYGTEFNGWFLGSPATTGQQLFSNGAATPPAEPFMNGDPVQIFDWAGPILAQSSKSLRRNRAARWANLVSGQFACPSNLLEAGPFPGATPDPSPDEPGFKTLKMVSYNAMRAIMLRGGTEPSGSGLQIGRQYFHPQVGGVEQTPFFYEPRIERVGNAAEKAFLADGARFTDVSQDRVTYNVEWTASAGGAFATEAPTAPDQFFRSYFRSNYRGPSYPSIKARNSYRHPRGTALGLNVAFFDGHVDYLSETESRRPDPWWPKDTVLPLPELNPDTRNLVLNQLTTQRPSWWGTGNPPLHYRVRR